MYNQGMKTKFLSPTAELAVWLRVLQPDGELRPQVARGILRLSFPRSDKKRMHVLSRKAQTGTLSPEEEEEMDGFERAGAMLSILKSKARVVLGESRRDF